MIGTTLSHYTIEAELGRGGMGIVYKAQDTKLDRTVAIKVLPSAALASADDRERFYREAKSAAALNHPNIAQVYQIDEAVPSDAPHGTEPSPFIAMEYISGGTLEDLIKKAPLSLADAVKVSSQVAEALKAAHDKDIVHRDIKSANVMITEDGIAKVLDFGLAKTNQSTMLTRMGSTLGTVAYMSPEQARGQEVDGRTDLYSLGTMLYEMVAGRLPFAGEYEQAVVYSILNEPPEPLTSLRTGVPMQLEWVVDKLLAKDAEYRYQSAAGLLADLKTLDLSGSGHSRRSMATMSAVSTPAMDAAPAAPGSVIPSWVWGSLVGVLLLGLATGWVLFRADSAEPAPPRLMEVAMRGYESAVIGLPHASPDGRYWTFSALDSAATPIVMMWDMLRNEHRRVPDSEVTWGAKFSPSGEWLAMRNNNLIYRARVPNGRALRVNSEWQGGVESYDWIDDENIIYSAGSDLKKLSIESGSVSEYDVSSIDSTHIGFQNIQYLSGLDKVLLSAENREGSVDLIWYDLASGSSSVLIQAVAAGGMLREDLVLYLSIGAAQDSDMGQVVAQRVDTGTGKLSGIPINISEMDVSRNGLGIGRDGTLFALQNLIRGGGRITRQVFTRYDPEAESEEPIDLPTAGYDRFWPSPNGSQLVVERTNASGPNAGTHLYIYDLETKSERRLTYANSVNRAPVWSSNGVIYYSVGPPASQEVQVYRKNADGSGPEELIVESGDFPALSPDGKWVAYTRDDGTNGGDVEALHLETGEIISLESTNDYSGDPAFSPNGQFIAVSRAPASGSANVSPEQRIFVHSFPDTERFSIQVVDQYADDPIWSSDGSRFYFRDGSTLSSLKVETSETFSVQSIPTRVASFPGSIQMRVRNDVGNGQLLIKHAETSQASLLETGANFNVLLSADAYVRALMGEE